MGAFPRFLNCINGTKSREPSHILSKMVKKVRRISCMSVKCTAFIWVLTYEREYGIVQSK